MSEHSDPARWAFTSALPEGVYVVDAEGRCTFINDSASRLLGCGPAAEMVGRNMQAVLVAEAWLDEGARAADARPTSDDATSRGPSTLRDGWLRKRDDPSVRVRYTAHPTTVGETVVVLTERGEGEEDGWSGALVESASDRSGAAQRTVDETVQLSEARFRTLADSIPQLTWMTGADGSIEWYNRRWYEYTGTTPAEMRGWGWRSVHHPDHVERVVARITEAFSNETPWEDTFPLRGRDGSYRWFLSRATPIRARPTARHPDGPILGWFGTNTDVTELRETEERLSAARAAADEANKAKSDFIANMSHELRTPLSAIIGYSELIRENLADAAEPADILSDLQKVEGNARHLLGLINDVLDLSKIESGRMDVFCESFEVSRLVKDVMETSGTLVSRKRNRLNVELDPDLGSMRSDQTKIKQVLLNLISNAAKFTQDGAITLSVARMTHVGQNDWLSFRVADTGIGMTAAQVARLFQRFTQADASTTRNFGGTGLGLAISQAFAQMLGGDLTVESELGRGTTFRFAVPETCPDPTSTDAPTDTVPQTGPTGQSKTKGLVLIVDDDPSQRELLARFLSREGFNSCEAADGRRGLELARTLRPKVILLDVVMPVMDGWSVLAELKSDPAVSSIPVVLVTFTGERTLAQSLGAAEYLAKPVDWNRFKLVMDRFLDGARTVLVVDDDTDMRRRMRHALERDGWAVAEAANGADALATVAVNPPSVVLLDLTMPIMDGFTFLRQFRQLPDHHETPVVVLTASDLTVDDRARLRSAEQILQKGSTDLDELARELNRLTVPAA